MAAKYFVHEGLQFQTIELPRRTFASQTGDDVLDAVTLDSVSSVLGADVVADLNALLAWWTEDRANDKVFLRLAKQLLTEKSDLVSGSVYDEDDTAQNTARRVHETSYQWVLPQGTSNCIGDLPESNTDLVAARNKVLVKSLEVQHNNIKKHRTADDAWDAWIAYEVADEASQEKSSAERGYFISPPVS